MFSNESANQMIPEESLDHFQLLFFVFRHKQKYQQSIITIFFTFVTYNSVMLPPVIFPFAHVTSKRWQKDTIQVEATTDSKPTHKSQSDNNAVKLQDKGLEIYAGMRMRFEDRKQTLL